VKSDWVWVVGGGLITLLLSFATPAVAETWRFALIGDTPYSEHERTELPKMMAAIADNPVAFIAHIGDFKKGSERCDDALFEDRQRLFASSRVPFVYVPGDNEWTDCDRLSNGAYDPLERLGKLRTLFWQKDRSLGQQSIPLERQPGSYPEHARFAVGPVLFVTLNLPGGNNNWGMTNDPRPEFLARNPVVLAWLKDSFALARRDKKSAIVLLFQANPSFTHYAQGFPHRGYRAFLETLRDETLGFSGQVVAVHGDTHISRVDQPLRERAGRTIQNFVRVETFGHPIMGWTEGIIDSDATNPLRFVTHPWPQPASP
jgi:hypothetical protein